MRIGAYQYPVTGDILENFAKIRRGIELAARTGIRLLVFPECAVTGYPPFCIKSSSDVDFDAVNSILEKLQTLAEKYQLYLVVGTIIKTDDLCYNSAIVFQPDGQRRVYSKRALWGWDRDNFSEGHDLGVVEIESLKVGIRICFEVRFPEYFRELYQQRTDLNLILFYDSSNIEDPDRFSMIKGHIQTRAVENVCPVLTCNTSSSFQTAPTILFDRSGRVLAEMERGSEGLLYYDLEFGSLDFGEQGRKEISDSLTKGSAPEGV